MATKYKSSLELANFICKFGKDLNLLDLAEEVVIPAFLDTSLQRVYTDTSYFFYDVEIVKLLDGDPPVLGIAGRFIKDTTLERNQIFNKDYGLLQDPISMPSALSAVFVLILNTHKLIYLKENKGAALLSTFETTCQRFINIKHDEFIRSQKEHAEEKEPEDKVTLKSLREKYPRPDVDIIPLASPDSLLQFINRFETLNNIQIKLIRPNDELDNSKFFAAVREQGNEIQAQQTTVAYRNSNGLDKKEAYAQLQAVTAQGNSRIDLSGVEPSGLKIKGNNENFKARLAFDSTFETIKDAARKMFVIFHNSSLNTSLLPESTKDDILEKISKIHERSGLD